MDIKRSAMKARQRRNRARRQASPRPSGRRKLTCETLESRVLLDAGGLFFGDGLPGAGLLDPVDPVTMADDTATDFDESGLYWLDVEPGFHVVREVVPDDFRQTFPVNFFPALQPDEPVVIGILPPQDGAHFVTVEPGQSVENIDFGNQKIEPGSISGVKWGDENGNAEFDPWESGLAGVTVFADLNDNGFFDANEPSAITTADIPETDFDEAGRYTLSGLVAGDYVIREVVPDGFRQTFPLIDLPKPLPLPGGSDVGIPVDDFATVEPGRLDFILAAGDVFDTEVAVTIHPSIFLPIEIDVIASSADVDVINLSGPQINGGTGDTSVFQILIISSSAEFDGELQFVDLLGGNIFASIPLTISLGLSEDGSHRVTLGPGETLEGLNFGNQAIDVGSGTISGRKWADLNGNAKHDPDEAGLAGVTIYSDLNFNFTFDPDEPHAVTTFDIPETDFDEGGLYSIGNLTPGFHVIREVVPDGFWQTFPISIAASPLEHGAHYVVLTSGSHVDNLDFGNQRIGFSLPGDFNNNGVVDGVDLDVWEEGYGSGNPQATADTANANFDGGSFLTWQRNLGRVTPQPPATSVALEESEELEELEVSSVPVVAKPSINIDSSLAGLARRDTAPHRRASRRLARENAFAAVGRSDGQTLRHDVVSDRSTATVSSESSSESDATASSEASTLQQAFDAALTLAFGE